MADMSHIAIMLNENKESLFLYISTKIQLTARVTSHVIVMYMPDTNMPLKCHIYPHMQISSYAHEIPVSVYMPYMNSLQPTV